jgi:hypothetical protein
MRAIPVNSQAEWRAEDDLRTLTEAEKIRKDPKRLKAAQGMAKKKLAEIEKVAGVTKAKDSA